MKIVNPRRIFLAVIAANLVSMLDSRFWRDSKGSAWLRTDEEQVRPQNANGCEQERGSSLPIIPILLVAILALIYFLGWKVLLIVLAAFVVITLGTFLYDRFPRRSPEQAHFWFHSDQELSTLWELLVGTERYSADAEDVWEWRGVEVREGAHRYHISISRKHDDRSFPIRIIVTYRKKQFTPEMRQELGRQFAAALEMDVKAGSVEHLDGNRFAFTEEQIFTPEARR
jgi:hypothetical protein